MMSVFWCSGFLVLASILVPALAHDPPDTCTKTGYHLQCALERLQQILQRVQQTVPSASGTNRKTWPTTRAILMSLLEEASLPLNQSMAAAAQFPEMCGTSDNDSAHQCCPHNDQLDLMVHLLHGCLNRNSTACSNRSHAYPAQKVVYNVSVSSEGGMCFMNESCREYNYSSLFRVNGILVPHLKRRGLHLLVLDRPTGHVLGTDTFDTHESAEEGQRMVDYIRYEVPGDSIVLVGVYDSEQYCTGECLSVLKEIGGSGNPIGVRSTYALIGYKGRLDYCSTGTAGFVDEEYRQYPGYEGRDGRQTEPVTLDATIRGLYC